MDLESKIIEALSRPDYVPLNQPDLSKALDLSKRESKQFRRTLHKLLDDGLIAKVKGDRFVRPHDADLVSGTIKFRQSGRALLLPDRQPGKPPREPLTILAEDTGVALHEDKVLVRLHDEKSRRQRGRDKRNRLRDGETLARVIRVLQRAHPTLTGTLKQSRMYHHVVPDDPRIIHDILVPPPERAEVFPKPKEGDKVVVRLLEWKMRHLNPEGVITEVLGKTHEPGAEFKAILHKYKLDTTFPDAVLAEVSKVPAQVSSREVKGRLDCRKKFTLTIDPDDAKDFDDALSYEETAKGGCRIGIHIADVSAYVKPGSQLDKEARRRGNSTYLVGCVIPMLPQALSNGICSLVENEDRLTKAVFLDFDRNGKHTGTTFANTVIRSSKRLTYRQAYAFLKKDDIAEIRGTPLPPAHQTGSTGRALTELDDREMHKIQKTIRRCWDIADKLRKARMQKGSLDLDMSEVKIFVDENGYADRIESIVNDESHQLIEEFMLAANEAVAKALFEAAIPFISRVHDEPDPEKLYELRDHMMTVGIAVGDLTNRPEVTRLLKKINDHPQNYPLKIQFLRSLKQACYRAQTDGHYGLYKTFYAHFTSPIRRYADLVVHRIFDYYLAKHGLDTAPARASMKYTKGDLDGIADHLTLTEQNSTEAERESVKIKLLEFFEREANRKKPSVFEAIVTDVKNHGMFIELTESMAFGMVHVSTLKDDLYTLSDDGTALQGRRRRKQYVLGQTIKVAVERVDRFKRQIDFHIVEDEEKDYGLGPDSAKFIARDKPVPKLKKARKPSNPKKKQRRKRNR
ncbi:RNB domain-containing ribonuclease [Ruficoccus sp. ZRK36]|uniref:ribonuclease R family protein n=1 Tax=Ruficoccus sp. ZRK36 TaxID=2866311 RepID=UPI001C72F241|nr:RNB domain-containing ribonuclease [Ruficoccus sp. ZRK36]QYY35795.1 RNB domain-containing ribonuclease [Ruficoccus sp. ZRK36]